MKVKILQKSIFDGQLGELIFVEMLSILCCFVIIYWNTEKCIVGKQKGESKMSLQKAKAHLAQYGLDGRVRLTEQSSATVELAAQALGVEAGRIAKTLSFIVDEKPVLILAEGTARIDNRKFKDVFHTKAKMIPFEDVEFLVGHAPGGVCPFGVNEGVAVYLDVSLKKYGTVFPAAGESNSDIELTISELEQCSAAVGWIDVCRDSGGNWS